jgi:hypothetical protein
MKSGKRAIFICIGILLILFMSWLIFNGLKPPVLPIGSLMPKLGIETCAGVDTLRCTPGRPVLVMLFSTRCPHCVYQLDMFEKRYAEMASFDLYLLTLEKDFRLCEDVKRWKNLTKINGVTWARIENEEFKCHFGIDISPLLFAFDSCGRLVHKIRGEAKMEKILGCI